MYSRYTSYDIDPILCYFSLKCTKTVLLVTCNVVCNISQGFCYVTSYYAFLVQLILSLL